MIGVINGLHSFSNLNPKSFGFGSEAYPPRSASTK